jgi:hypothetical protein
LVIEVRFAGTIEDELLLENTLVPVLADHAGWDPCKLSTEFHHV